MLAVAVAPNLVTPISAIARSRSRLRTPPAAFTPILGDTVVRMRRRSSRVAPPGANPVEVLT